MSESFKDEIRERAGVAASGYLYRGAGVSETEDILTSRSIPGDTYPVWWVNNTPEEIDDTRARDVESLDVADELRVELTGGVSSSVAGAQKFSQSLSELGVVLAFDPGSIPQELKPITYELEWFDEHAGLLGRVESLVNGEVRTASDDLLRGTVRPDGVIDSTGRGNLEITASTPLYSDEQEYYSNSGSVNLSGAVVGAVTVAHTQRAVGGSAQGALAEYPGYKFGFASRGYDVTKFSDEELAERLHETLEQDAGIALERDLPYYVLLMDDSRWKQGAGIDRDQFILAFDGSEVTTNPATLPRWLPV